MGLKLLSNEDIQRIHEMTLDLLESVGIWFHDCPEAVELFEKHGCLARWLSHKNPSTSCSRQPRQHPQPGQSCLDEINQAVLKMAIST